MQSVNFDALPGRLDDDHSDDQIRRIPETPPRPEPDNAEPEEGVDILEVAGHAFVYRIPRFPVVTINLRQFFQTVTPFAMMVLFKLIWTQLLCNYLCL